MSADSFEATFRLRVERRRAWQRLTESTEDSEPASGDQVWLPGFDCQATIVEADPPSRLRATKDDEPCAGTDIVVTLEDEANGTRVHVVQSRFGDWLPARYEMMAVGWRFIVADLQTYLATGVHARRHLRPWGDLGAEVTAADGGLRIGEVRRGGLAHQLGMTPGDLLLVLGGAPVAALDDLVAVLRVLEPEHRPAAEWARSGELVMVGPDATP